MRRSLLPASLMLLSAGPAPAQPLSPVGLYRAQAGPDVASMLELTADGHFRYQLSEGAMDEGAEGLWRATTSGVELETVPHPRPAEFTLGPVAETSEAPFSLRVIWPTGEGIPAVDLRLGFTNGESVTAYTQQEGWTLPPEDSRRPAWVELSEPFYGTASPRFTLPAAKKGLAVTVTLIPNDMGVAPFDHTPATLTADGLVLHWRGRDVPYRRIGKDEDR